MSDTASSQEFRSSRTRYHVELLDAFVVSRDGHPVSFPSTGQRLLAYLALRGKPVPRSQIVDALWVDHDGAAGCLRSAAHRARSRAPGLLASAANQLSLGPGVTVDIDRVNACCRQLLGSSTGPAPAVDPEVLSSVLLPGWDDPWVTFAREWLRQRCLHAMERMGERELAAGRPEAAIEIAMRAVAIEPLRESPRRLLVAAHLADGNPSEAVRDFRGYSELLDRELGLAPTCKLHDLLPTTALP